MEFLGTLYIYVTNLIIAQALDLDYYGICLLPDSHMRKLRETVRLKQ